MAETDVIYFNKPKPQTRHERALDEQYEYTFSPEQPIAINPFQRTAFSDRGLFLSSVFGEFVEYVTDDVAKVYIPPEANNSTVDATWFNEDEGYYLLHESFITPQ